MSSWLALKPIRRFEKTFRQKIDIEAKVTAVQIHLFLGRGQEVQQKCRKSTFLKNACNIAIAWAVAATSAAMREQDHTSGSLRYNEITVESVGSNLYNLFGICDLHW